ncbi:MAG: DUF6090 family protein [Saprospiraceae bacterium]|nr:DUF6090 family protein [Saprospiraceae bacterium]
MLTFLRRIRKSLIESGSARKYLLYAIGEILLVMVGILLALQVNNWNELRKNQSKERHYLNNIRSEIVSDSTYLIRSWVNIYSDKIASLQLGKNYLNGKYAIKDTSEFILSIGFGGRNALLRMGQFNSTYRELVSTGNLSLISDENLRQQIVGYYSSTQFIDNNLQQNRSGIVSFLNSLRAFNGENPDYVNKDDIPRILKGFQSDKFHDIINKELSYAYSANRRINNVIRQSNDLNSKILVYLEDR